MAATVAVAAPAQTEVSDWSRVDRIVYRVSQQHRYSYSEPVRLLHHRLLVVPADLHADQRLLSHAVAADGALVDPREVWDQDQFGNRVYTLEAAEVGRSLSLDASYAVERGPARESLSGLASQDLTRYLESTPLTSPARCSRGWRPVCRPAARGRAGGPIAPTTGYPPR